MYRFHDIALSMVFSNYGTWDCWNCFVLPPEVTWKFSF